MHLKPKVWYCISLLFFVAAIFTWRYADKYAERHTAPLPPASSKIEHPPLTKAVATNAAVKAKTYRITNTKENVAQLLHNKHALILRNALIDTTVPVGLKIPDHLRHHGAPGSYLVQADRALDKSFYAELKDAGATYVPMCRIIPRS